MSPCDLVQTVQVDFARCDQGILEKTLKQLGYKNVRRNGDSLYFVDEEGNSCSIGYGRLTVRNGEDEQVNAMAAKIRAKVSDNVVRQVAKQNNWNVRTGTDGMVKQLWKPKVKR